MKYWPFCAGAARPGARARPREHSRAPRQRRAVAHPLRVGLVSTSAFGVTRR